MIVLLDFRFPHYEFEWQIAFQGIILKARKFLMLTNSFSVVSSPAGNGISSIPSEIGNLTNLHSLDLSKSIKNFLLKFA